MERHYAQGLTLRKTIGANTLCSNDLLLTPQQYSRYHSSVVSTLATETS